MRLPMRGIGVVLLILICGAKLYGGAAFSMKATDQAQFCGSCHMMYEAVRSHQANSYKYCQPYLKNLWIGYPFIYEYNRARGHTYALHDVLDIDRINRYSDKAALPSTCYNCKTTKMVEWIPEYGDDFWAMEFHHFREELDLTNHTIGCATCHDPQNMALRITSVPLDEALKRLGKDWREASRNEMRSLVCAQCHVEYYFQDPSFGVPSKPIFPWDLGKNPEDIYEYYKGFGSTTREGFQGHFIDWTHPVSDTPMIKIQHPEYEMWHDGPHGAAGVTCADCHMPYRRLDGKKKISSHLWTSSLKSMDGIRRSCGQCHADKTPEYLKERVVYSQKRTWDQLMVAQDLSVPLLPEADLVWDLNKGLMPKPN